jgi:hypothetical protein
MKCHVCRQGNLVRQQVGWSCDKCRVAVLSAVPRYRIYPMPFAPASVVETPDGEWCQWNDIQEEMAALRAEAEKLHALVDEIEDDLESCKDQLKDDEAELQSSSDEIEYLRVVIGQLREGIRYYGGKDLLGKIDNDPEEVLG